MLSENKILSSRHPGCVDYSLRVRHRKQARPPQSDIKSEALRLNSSAHSCWPPPTTTSTDYSLSLVSTLLREHSGTKRPLLTASSPVSTSSWKVWNNGDEMEQTKLLQCWHESQQRKMWHLLGQISTCCKSITWLPTDGF